MSYLEKRKNFEISLLPEPMKNSGSGLVNNVINNLPFELHIPGYNFLGAGTKLEHLARNDKGINKLDELAKQHDIEYAKNKDDLDKRHEADFHLQEGAWNRVLDPKAGLDERATAWLTTNAVKLKQWLGKGCVRSRGKGLPMSKGLPNMRQCKGLPENDNSRHRQQEEQLKKKKKKKIARKKVGGGKKTGTKKKNGRGIVIRKKKQGDRGMVIKSKSGKGIRRRRRVTKKKKSSRAQQKG